MYTLLAVIIIFFLYILYLNRQNMKDGKFQSYRLGNVIDMWYFSNFSDKKIKDLKKFETKKNDCLSYFLIKNKKIDKKQKQYKFKEDWPIYYYKNIIKILPHFERNLRNVMQKYDDLNYGLLFDQKFQSKKHCVIHYRLGDVVTLGDTINYEDIVNVIEDLKEEIEYIEIMDGGQSHHPVRLNNGITSFKNSLLKSDVNTSLVIYNKFYSTLCKKFPNMKVIKSEKRTSDEDFYRMTSAPILITGGGSYALASAIASNARIIRTPSCKNLDHPKEGLIKDIKINKKNCDWKTYSYTML